MNDPMRQKTRKKHRKGKRIVLSLLVLILTISAVRFAVNQTAFQDFLHFNTDVASMEHGWNLILVNWEYKIPKDWKVELTELSNGQSVDSRIYPDLQQMFDDMRAQEVYPVVASVYRTAKKQRELMDDKVDSFLAQGYSRSEAKSEAKKFNMQDELFAFCPHTGWGKPVESEKTGKTPVIIVSFTRKNRGKTGSLPSERGCLSVLLC